MLQNLQKYVTICIANAANKIKSMVDSFTTIFPGWMAYRFWETISFLLKE